MKIRILNKQDVHEFKRIRLEGLRINPEAFGSSYEEEMSLSDEFFQNRIIQTEQNLGLGAFDGKTLIGTALFFRENKSKLYHKGFVVGVYITPAYRGKGIGKRLLKILVSETRKYSHLSKLQLSVNAANVTAKNIYQHCGFIKEGSEKDAIRINEKSYDEDLMVLSF